MRIAFDENVPLGLVKVFQIFASERKFKRLIGGEFEIESAKQYTPAKGDYDYVAHSDVPWLKRFSAAGGKVVISGNTDMKNQPHERLALIECGFVVLFFENQWSTWKFFPKCALLLHWWPVIALKVKRAKPGSFWHIPSNWPEAGKLRKISNEDPKMLRLERRKKTHVRRVKQKADRASPIKNTDGPLFDYSTSQSKQES